MNEDFLNNRPYYILKKGKIVSATLFEWAAWFENGENRRIDYTQINEDVYVSTVFLGIDHNFRFSDESWKEHVPILFETMVFGGEFSHMGWRYSSYGEAKSGHWYIVDAVRENKQPHVPFGERPAFELFLEIFKEDQPEDIDNEENTEDNI